MNDRLTFATYNIHHWIGTDGIHAPERVLDVVRQLSADVVGLQELDGPFWRRSEGRMELLAELGRQAGYQVVALPTMDGAVGCCGNALLTRLPLAELRSVDLTVAGREPRSALLARLRLPERGTLLVAVTHFGLQRWERGIQTWRLLAELQRFAAAGRHEPQIVLGDLNEWLPNSPALRLLHESFGPTPAARTFPSGLPVFALDRILANNGALLERASACRVPLARVASDHLPLRGEVRLEA